MDDNGFISLPYLVYLNVYFSFQGFLEKAFSDARATLDYSIVTEVSVCNRGYSSLYF